MVSANVLNFFIEYLGTKIHRLSFMMVLPFILLLSVYVIVDGLQMSL